MRHGQGNHFVSLFLKFSHVTQWDVTWLYFWLIFHWNYKETCCYQRGCGNYDLSNITTVRRKLSTFQRGVNQVSMIISSWDLLNKITFVGNHSIAFQTFFFERQFWMKNQYNFFRDNTIEVNYFIVFIHCTFYFVVFLIIYLLYHIFIT